jgi:hypothetical protein
MIESSRAEALNRVCDCVGTDVVALRERFGKSLAETHANLFAAAPVFVSTDDVVRMRALIAAVERVVGLPAYREHVLSRAPALARLPQATRGVFLGFDFHITPQGPRLIEINTNAGGGILTAAARGAQLDCCTAAEEFRRDWPSQRSLEDEIVAMFLAEWRLARATPLRRVAVVDDSPTEQFLYPEFLRFCDLLRSHGIEASIADPRELRLSEGVLRIGDDVVDLVYNRTTDFHFASPEHAVLAEAYAADAAVITPHPRAHALFADKRNLALLTNETFLRDAGVDPLDIRTLLEMIPLTHDMQLEARDWWSERRRWFFKPAQGFGSRGSYRGDKLTRGVFEDIRRGSYVAQALTPPPQRDRGEGTERRSYKVDVRCYAYAGRVQQMAARMYQGQTTNFRTPGGGFAPVYVVAPAGNVSDC